MLYFEMNEKSFTNFALLSVKLLCQPPGREIFSDSTFYESSQDMSAAFEESLNIFQDTSITKRRGLDGKYTCQKCQYVSFRAGDMKKHMECTHSHDRRHVCDMCGHKYKQASHLYRHKRETCHKILARAAVFQL